MSDSEYSDEDEKLNEDLEAVNRALILTGSNPSRTFQNDDGATSAPEDSVDSAEDDIELAMNLQKQFSNYPNSGGELSPLCIHNEKDGATSSPEDSEDSVEDDIEFAKNLQKRILNYPNSGGELCIDHEMDCGIDSDVEDDFEVLKAIRRRFAAYSNGEAVWNTEDFNKRFEQVGKIALEKEASNNLFVKTNINAEEGFPNCVDTDNIATQNLGAHSDHDTSELGATGEDCITSELVEWPDFGAKNIPTVPLKTTGFPKSALAFVDAIKKNRSCQRVIRSKMMQVQARIEEIKTYKDRVKILKDYQTGCKKRMGRALAQKKDARVQLISVAKQRSSKKSNDKKTPATCYGPPINPHVAIYKEMLTKCPSTVTREKWSKKEIENLKKGIKQQFQEKLLQQSVDILNDTEEWSKEGSNLDMIVASVRDYDITPQNMRAFLPKINWEQLCSMYVPSRSGMECQSRWLNCEDPLINWDPWTNMEDKTLLHIIQQKGPSNWIDIAVSLGTHRTPFQCLARYQRSLNASIIRSEWTKEEDIKIHVAVEEYGENNWQAVASVMEGRTGTQCSNRWMKSLHPARKRVGKWTPEEDKHLKVAVMIIGPKNWSKIAEFVPGRMQSQCRERWTNCLDPSLNFGTWTSEEDLFLEEAIKKHGYYWSKVATCVPHRTDNQCMRRWTMLFPEQVPILRAAKKTKRAAMISNFVDRESERPTIGPNDFIQFPAIEPPPRLKTYRRRARHSRKVDSSGQEDTSEEALRLTYGSEGADGQEITSVTQVRRSSRQRKRKVIIDDDSMITQDPVGRNRKKKLESNHNNLLISECVNPDNLESSYNFTADSPKRREFERSELKDEACSPENHVAGDDDDMTLASFLGQSQGAKTLPNFVEPAETFSASVEVDYTAQVDEDASSAGFSRAKRPKRPSTAEESSSDHMQVPESEDDLPLSRFCKKLKDTHHIAETVSASAEVGYSAQVDESARAANVNRQKKPKSLSTDADNTAQVDEDASSAVFFSRAKRSKRPSTAEESSSDHMQLPESEDDLPLSRFCKKLKDTRHIAETVSASAEVGYSSQVDESVTAANVSRQKKPKSLSIDADNTAQVDEDASSAGCSRPKRPKRLSPSEETSDHMQVAEIEDDLPLSCFSKKLKDTNAIPETVSASAEVDYSAQMDESASADDVNRPKKAKRSSPTEETSHGQMKVEESGDDMPLSRFCKKLKDTHSPAEEADKVTTLSHFYRRLKKRKGQPIVKK